MREEDAQNKVSPSFIGIDEGRAKLYFGACLRPESKMPSHHVCTRSFYLFKTGWKRRQRRRGERVRSNEALRQAYEALGDVAASNDFARYISVRTAHFDIIWNENVRKKDEAFDKMNFYRQKQSCLTKAANQLVDAGV